MKPALHNVKPDFTPQCYQLPPPPSTNAIWRSVVIKGRVRVLKSAEYRKWLGNAGAQIAVQRVAGWLSIRGGKHTALTGPLQVHLDVGHNNRRDLDGYLKPILDLLQYSKVIENDKQVKKISMAWAEGVTDCRIEILPYDAERAG